MESRMKAMMRFSMMRGALTVCAAAVSVCVGLGLPAQAAPPQGYTLTWSDEFNGAVGSTPNTAVWNYDTGGGGWGNGELETYVSDQAHAHIISDGAATDGRALQIQATKDANGNYFSARLNTGNKITTQYGYIEARLRLPVGKGIWPAFWMLGSNIGSVGWPTCGEMDIMENLGSEPSINHGSMHGPGYSGGNSRTATYTLPNGQRFTDGYHTFALRWTPNQAVFYVDGNAYETRTPYDLPSGSAWVFNQPFFFIINMAVGGGWPGSPDASTVFPQNYLIDYIRVYKFLPPVGRTISLRSLANNLFVCADNYGNNPLIANRTSASTWEQYQVIDRGNGQVALKALANNLYVCADNAGTSPLIANRTSIGGWETFQWVDAGNGNAALFSLANNQYVCADNYGNNPLIANRITASGWESFVVTVY